MTTLDTVRTFITSNFYSAGTQPPLTDDTSLLESGIVDSTGVFEVILFIERTFAITVTTDEMLPENLDSINRIAAFVKRRLGRA